ncbi:MAG TPA: hypothetical protein VN436_09660, partial [Holophaga sp.]|nr:hypothetical protein [Holophaga sp.]
AFDLSIEEVVLLVLGVFAALFGALLFRIHAGVLPYTPDSMYGLFLVLVAMQTITLGKTPFGDLRRSWLVVTIGIGAAVFGMGACFIPGPLSGAVRTVVGTLLAFGGTSLLVQLSRKGRGWMERPGVLRQLASAAALVYLLSLAAGLVTLLPGITSDPRTAVLLLGYGASLFWLAWCIRRTRTQFPPKAQAACAREASLPLSQAMLTLMAVLLTLLGLLLFPVNLGLLPFSPDGQLGLLMVIMAVQMMALGETPVGAYRRAWPLMLTGSGFAALGVFSCIVPGVLTGRLQLLLGTLNVLGAGVFFIRRRLDRRGGEAAGPAILRKLTVLQTILNAVGMAFGLSMLLPGIVPGLVISAILVVNGLLLFML